MPRFDLEGTNGPILRNVLPLVNSGPPTIGYARPPRGFYVEAFRRAETGDVSEVTELLESSDRFVRREAIKQIARRRLADAAPRLEQVVAEDNAMKLDAMLALERLALPESRSTFLRGLDDEEVRWTALRGLFAIGDPEAIPAAESTYHTGDRNSRTIALYVLRRAGTPAALDSLRRLLEEEKSWRWRRKIKKALRRVEKHTSAS